MTDVSTSDLLARKYDRAAPGWGDKMRLLGYRDAYLGLLAESGFRAPPGHRVLDIGCGSGAFAEAWVAIHGPDQAVTLLDPSAGMLDRAEAALRARGAAPTAVRGTLEQYRPDAPHESVMAAHVLEHVADPAGALRAMRALVRPGGRLWLVVSKPHWCNAIVWLQWRHHAFRPAEVRALLEGAGWAVELDHAFPAGPPSRTSRGYLARAI